MIFNITKETFGGSLRNGDMIAACNVVEHLRLTMGKDIRFHLLEDAIDPSEYCKKFYSFLLLHTDYFSEFSGEATLPWARVNLWDFRDIAGDLVKIPCPYNKLKKIVIFPLVDANYNKYRNWNSDIINTIVNKYNGEEYEDYEKIVCSPYKHEWSGFNTSNDLMENIMHIMTADIFVGGDTGTTHFAFALNNGPRELIYYGSSRALIHTLPFYLLKGKGTMINYWLNMEGTTWVN